MKTLHFLLADCIFIVCFVLLTVLLTLLSSSSIVPSESDNTKLQILRKTRKATGLKYLLRIPLEFCTIFLRFKNSSSNGPTTIQI